MPFDVISHTCSVTLHKASVTLRKASVCIAWLHADEPRQFFFQCLLCSANDSLAKNRQPLAKASKDVL